MDMGFSCFYYIIDLIAYQLQILQAKIHDEVYRSLPCRTICSRLETTIRCDLADMHRVFPGKMLWLHCDDGIMILIWCQLLSLDCDNDDDDDDDDDADDADDAAAAGGGGDGDVIHQNQQNGSVTHSHRFGCMLFQVLQHFPFATQ